MRMSCLPVGRSRRWSEVVVGVPDDAAVAAGVEGPHDPDAGHDLDHQCRHDWVCKTIAVYG